MRFIIICLAFLTSCEGKKEPEHTIPVLPQPSLEEKQENYFPVTAFIRGQMLDIKERGINPLKVISTGNRTDSSWLKVEEMENSFSSFLQPHIDTANLKSTYKESRFMDQTINAFTWTYEPRETLSDSVDLLHWTVYVDPESYRVKSLYMVKRNGTDGQVQLTWNTNQEARQVYVKEINGKPVVEKEITIKWDF